jgi:hypothetical protein
MNVRKYVVAVTSASASVWACPFCSKFHVRVRKGQRGVGRGHGLRVGSQAGAAVVQHIKAEHAAELALREATP